MDGFWIFIGFFILVCLAGDYLEKKHIERMEEIKRSEE